MFIIRVVILTTFVILTQQTCDLNLEVVTDLTPQDCYGRNQYYSNEDNCLPLCQDLPTSVTGKCDQDTPCIPGYTCAINSHCAVDPTSCAIYHYNINQNAYYNALFKPVCSPSKDVSWAAKQCKGEPTTGRCFCFDKVGNRLFGHEWSSKAVNMTCACSRRKADLRAANPDRFVSLHCDSMGNYEPLQCDVESGLCWCADNKSGELKSAVVPQAAMNRLPCHAPTKVGSQYLRQCESHKYAQDKILHELKIHGTTNLHFGTLLCDEDGAYGAYKIQNGIAYCTWRDNTNIKTWQSDATFNIENLNCNCARDSVIFEQAGQSLIQHCVGSGNYNPYQKVGNVGYCVDKDGFKNSITPPTGPEDCA